MTTSFTVVGVRPYETRGQRRIFRYIRLNSPLPSFLFWFSELLTVDFSIEQDFIDTSKLLISSYILPFLYIWTTPFFKCHYSLSPFNFVFFFGPRDRFRTWSTSTLLLLLDLKFMLNHYDIQYLYYLITINF